MADEEDVKAMLQGEQDLMGFNLDGARFVDIELSGRGFTRSSLANAVFERCNLAGSDFRNAKVHGAKFLNCKLHDAHFSGAVGRVDFTGSDLRNSRMQGLYTGCKFNDADLRGADFRGSEMRGDNHFEGTLYDETTNFDNVRSMRSVSRLPIFEFHEFGRGVFTRKSGNPQSADERPITVSERPEPQRQITQQLTRHAATARLLAESLSVAIQQQVSEIAKPNEADALERYQRFIDIMTEVQRGLTEIGYHLEQQEGRRIDSAAGVVERLQNRLKSWVEQNEDVMASFGAKTALLGAGSAFLAFCGAPAYLAFPSLVFMLEGKSAVEAIKGLGKG